MNNDPKGNKSIPVSEDPDLILLDRILTKAGGVVFPPPPEIPDATDEQVERLMKATESIRNSTSSLNEDPDLLLLDQVLTNTGSIVFPHRTNSPDATDEQVEQLMTVTEDIRKPKVLHRLLHFPTIRFLAIAASLAVIFGIGLRSLISDPTIAVVIDLHPQAPAMPSNSTPSYSPAVTIGAVAVTAKKIKGSGRAQGVAIGVAAVTAALWDPYVGPFLSRVASEFPNKDQRAVKNGVVQGLAGHKKGWVRFFYGNNFITSKSESLINRLISKNQSRNLLYVTTDADTGKLIAMVFEAETGKKLVETKLQERDPARVQDELSHTVSGWIRDGLL